MKYKGRFLFLIKLLMARPMIKMYGKDITRNVLRKTKPIYKELLQKVDDIGSGNPMASNLYIGFVFLAIWKADEGRIQSEDFREVIREFMNHQLVQRFIGGMDVNKPKDMKRMESKFHQMDQWAKNHPEYREKTWDFNFDEKLHEDGTYYYFTRCPIEKFARENGFLEILPVICDIDYLSAKARGVTLHREYILATGDKICDYWFVGDKMKDTK